MADIIDIGNTPDDSPHPVQEAHKAKKKK